MTKETINAKILRFDPDRDEKSYYQDYSVEVDRPVTIHELLTMIRRNMDG